MATIQKDIDKTLGITDEADSVKETKRGSWWARHTEESTPGHKAHTGLRIFGGFIVFLLFVFPYVIMLLTSLKARVEILSIPATYIPKQWHFDNYVTMWSAPETPVGDNLMSTLIIASCSTLLVLLVATPAAYYTARFKFPGRGVFLACILLTQMLQPAVLVAGLFKEFLALGLHDTLLAMILVNSAFNLTFATWMMHAFFASVPKEISEAAEIDGCSHFVTLFKINLPLVWPGIVTAVIYTFVAAWNEFAASLVILSSDYKQPLSVALTKFVGQYQTSWQHVFSVSIIAIVPVLILFALVEKRLIGGLTAGAVKG